MKRQIIPVIVVLLFTIPFVTHKLAIRSAGQVVGGTDKSQTTEFGEFDHNGTIYGVYGDAATNTITSVTLFWSGVPVYSFSGTYHPTGWPIPHGTNPWVENMTVQETSTSTPFNIASAELQFY
ncbi:hypothetical protein [Mucilaginibacter sp. L3T2-6]|uniref:hypothetical protein n=1 Tax=Mucilaginibacter sp. L3T2-6 TaxID=3062491 RepID=UPI00267524E0|nr:hypothetical protein [Mucilaginibacter sp. L3T2-6]MDO3642303.1 hypothetical protein [Mucilaginibacter sp. L3T2-6]MDV6214798.1 hypothetical protein [Mucilaginibacter sp. L3T2-6]